MSVICKDEGDKQKRISILELNSQQARDFFLKGESYCTLALPPYIEFDNLLINLSQELDNKNLANITNRKTLRDCEDTNHVILNNKDGKYAWRPIQLIHPVLYVSLVHQITKDENWETICERFKKFTANNKIKCLSLPVKSLTDNTDKAEQINKWWTEIEQKSIELSLDYEYVIHTDITDCYSSIYTHSISWAIHDKNSKRKSPRTSNWQYDRHISSRYASWTN